MDKIIIADDAGVREDVSLEEALEIIKNAAADDSDEVVWVDFEDATEAEIDQIEAVAGMHPLTAEDIPNTKVREKWEDFDNYLYIVGHGLNFNEGRDVLDTVNASFLSYDNFVLSFHTSHLKSVDAVVARIQREFNGKLPSKDWVVYGILDELTDLYMDEVERFELEVDKLDEEVLSSKLNTELLDRIRKGRRHLAMLRRRLAPKREFMQMLCARDHELLTRETQVLMRDVLDHVIRSIEIVDVTRDILSDAQANYLAQISNRMNQVMQVLSVVATVMLPLTLISGIFGMNVHLPGQDVQEGYAWFGALMGIMGIVGVGLLFYFRKCRWL